MATSINEMLTGANERPVEAAYDTYQNAPRDSGARPYTVVRVPGITEQGPLQQQLEQQYVYPTQEFRTNSFKPAPVGSGGGGAYTGATSSYVPMEEQLPAASGYMRGVQPAQPVPEQHGEFVKGFLRSIPQTKAMLAGAGAAIADWQGHDQTAGDLAFYAQQKMEESQAPELKAAVESYKDIDSITKFGDYFAGLLGEQTINIGSSLLGGGLGAVTVSGTGKAALARIANGAIEKKAAQLISAGVAPDAARAAAVNAVTKTIGAQAGGMLPEFLQNTGENYLDNYERGGLMYTNPGMDIGTGILQSAVSLLGGENQLLRKYLGVKVPENVERTFKQKLMQNASSLPKAMLGEGAEEGMQEWLGAVNSMIQNGNDHITPDDVNQIMEAAVAGALVGSASGGAGVMVDMLKKSPKTDLPGIQQQDLPAVDLQKKFEDELQQIDPFSQISKAEGIMRDAIRQEAQQAVYDSETSFAKHRDPLVKSLHAVKANLASARAGRSPEFAMLATQEQKDKYIKNLEKKQQAIIAKLAGLAQAQRTDIDKRKEQFEKDLNDSDKKARKAFRETVTTRFKNLGYDANLTAEEIVDDRRYKEALFKKDPIKYTTVMENLRDANQYVQRKLNKADERLSKLYVRKQQHNVYLELLNQGAIPYNDREYEFVTSELADIDKESSDLVRRKHGVIKSANNMAKTIARTADLDGMNMEMQSLYSLADQLDPSVSVEAQMRNKLRNLADQQIEDRINNILKDANTLKLEASLEQNPTKDFQADFMRWNADQMGTAKQQIGLPEARTFEQTYNAMQQNVGLEQAAALNTQVNLDKVAADQFMRNTIAEQQQRVYEASPQYKMQQKINQDKLSMDNALDGGNLNRAAIPQQTTQARRDLEAEELQRQYKNEERSKVQRRNIQQQRQAFERYTELEKEIDFQLASERTQQVYDWMRNTLKELPGLTDVVTICSSVTDQQVPVAVQNALVNLSFNPTKTRGIPQAMYCDGKIYVFADRVKSKAQAVRLLMHEGVAHYGLRAIMTPRQFTGFMAAVYRDAYGTPLWREFERQRPAYENANDLVRTEEFIAWMAERESPKTLLERLPIVKDIYNFIRKLYQRLFGVDGYVTEADIHDLLALSAQNLASKKPKGVSSNYTIWGRAAFVSGALDKVTPQIEHIDLVGANAFTAPYGWGTYFSTPQKLADYYKRFNTRQSGVPGMLYKNYAPTYGQFLNWDQPLSQQEYVTQHLTKIFRQMPPQAIPTPNGVQVIFLGKPVGMFPDTNSYKQFIQTKGYLEQVTGKDVYQYFASQAGDDKTVATQLRNIGIAGTTFKVNGKSSYCLFEGDELSQNGDPNYSSPEVRFMISEDTTYDQMPDLYLESWKAQQLNQQTWLEKISNVWYTGKSKNVDGSIIKHTGWERAAEGLFDKYRRVQVVQRYLKETIGPHVIRAATNIYQHLTGLVNRINSMRTKMLNNTIAPICVRVGELNIPAVNKVLDDLKNQGKKITEQMRVDAQWHALDEYLLARHALERNAEINRRYRGKNKLESPSGLTDQQAQEIIAKYSDVVGMEEVAREFDKLGRMHLDLLDYYKLVPKNLTDKLRATYKHYVPLKNWEEFVDDLDPDYVHKRSKAGVSVGGREFVKAAKGREGLAESPSTHLILQLTDTIGIGEKNNISRRLLQLVREAPNKDLWEIATPKDEKGRPYFRMSEKGDGTIYYERKEHSMSGEGLKFINVVDEQGNRQRIGIRDVALAAALRNENVIDTGPVIDFLRKITQMFSALLTTYNPAFAIKNYSRDIQTALLNMSSVLADAEKNNLLGKENNVRKRIIKDATTLRMAKFLWAVTNGKEYTGPDSAYLMEQYKKFEEFGGHGRMFMANDFKTMYKDVRDLSKQKGSVRKTLDSAIKYLDAISDVSENATRFSVFCALTQEFDNHIAQEARKNNWTAEQMQEMLDTAHQRAANEALEVTVNFSRKGSWAPLFNSLWAFSSANIGGNIRILRTLWRHDDTFATNAKRTAAFMAYTTACAIPHAFLCAWMMGKDDDGVDKYDKIPDYIKDANLIIPAPFGDGGYVKIPLPYGYNTFWVAANAIADTIRGRSKPSGAASRIFGAAFDNFNPTGGSSLLNLIPTIFRPIGEIVANKNSFGYALMPESTHTMAGEKPDSQKYWGTNPMWCRAVAETLNSWTFGSKVESGFIDVSPETIQHLVESYMGGLGRVITQTLNIAVSPVSGAPVEIKDIPIANSFFGKVGYSDTLNEFTKIRNTIQTGVNELDLARKDRTLSPEERNAIIQKNRTVSALKGRYDSINAQLNNIRKQEKENERKNGTTGTAYYEQKETLQKRKEFLMKELNRTANKMGLDYRSK